MKISNTKLTLNEALFNQALSIDKVPGFAKFLTNMKTKSELQTETNKSTKSMSPSETEESLVQESLLESDAYDSIQVGTCFMFNELNTVYCVLSEFIGDLVVEDPELGDDEEVFGEVIKKQKELHIPLVSYASFMHKSANEYAAGKEWLQNRADEGKVHILTRQEIEDLKSYTENKLYNNKEKK